MKIILNIATHGDEKIGSKVAQEIEKLNIDKDILTVLIANQKAFDLGKRCIDQDLNRSFPGNQNGNYEERRAYELSPIIKSADIVIDIHSTTSELKDAVIVTKLDDKTLECIKVIQPKHALVMKATKDNALISQAKVGIAFEYGKDNDQATVKKTTVGIKRLLNHLGLISRKIPKSKIKTTYYDVVATVEKPEGYTLLKTIKNYRLVSKGKVFAKNGKHTIVADQDFYPILFGNSNYEEIFGFKAVKINIT
jgi:succinylglutamate desuccinylase